MKYYCQFHTRKHEKELHYLYIPENIIGKSLEEMDLSIGSTTVKVQCIPTSTNDSNIVLETYDPLLSSLPPMDNVILLKDLKRRILTLGPLVALLIHVNSPDKLQSHSLKEYFTECQRWFQRKGGFFFLFPFSSFLKEEPKGMVYQNEEWVLHSVPDPHVIYNRIHSRKAEKSSEYKKALNGYDMRFVHIFNTSFFTKAEVYNILKDSPLLLPHLPATNLEMNQLNEMLTDHRDIFIKALQGSKGRFIIRVQEREHDYLLHQNSFAESSPLSFTSYSSLEKQIRSWCHPSSFFIQETIPFCTFEGQQLDFRFLCHINREGRWVIVSSVARVASHHQFVANVDQGGRMEQPIKVLQALFPTQDSRKLLSDMKSLSLASASLLSESLEGHFAELGIDIGIDNSGKPWIIEVNSKPSKRTYIETDRIRPSVKALYDYSTKIWIEKED
ncbi:YheC/YheD family endospore coat-associated protein [Rossellomorea aquimaris]|uniref:YheC/YheD family endospore coat-associated protein n=1 Tax=Rossellomorea aquimaris TaxID=189382 RepID=UPI000A6440FA|nr:YheC/YheD family protein [Rossellomorea aquimaris]